MRDSGVQYSDYLPAKMFVSDVSSSVGRLFHPPMVTLLEINNVYSTKNTFGLDG